MASSSRSTEQGPLPSSIEAPRQLSVHAARLNVPDASAKARRADGAVLGQIFKASKDGSVRKVKGAATWFAPQEGEVRVVDSSTSEALSTYLLPPSHLAITFTSVASHLPTISSGPLILFNAAGPPTSDAASSPETHAYLPARKGGEYGIVLWREKNGLAERSWIALHSPASHLSLLNAYTLMALHIDGSHSLAHLAKEHITFDHISSAAPPLQTHQVLAVLTGKSAWERIPQLKLAANTDGRKTKAIVVSLCSLSSPEMIGGPSSAGGKRRGKGQHKRNKTEGEAHQASVVVEPAPTLTKKRSKALSVRVHVVDSTARTSGDQAGTQHPDTLIADLPIALARSDELMSVSLSSDGKSLVTLSMFGVLQQYVLRLSMEPGASTLEAVSTGTLICCPILPSPKKEGKGGEARADSSKAKTRCLPPGATAVLLAHNHVLFILPPTEGTSGPEPGVYLISLVLGAAVDFEPLTVPASSSADGETSLSVRAARIGGGVILSQTRVQRVPTSNGKKHRDASPAHRPIGECRVNNVPVDIPNAASIRWAIGNETREWTNRLLWPRGTPLSVALSTNAKGSQVQTDSTTEKHPLVVALRNAETAAAKDAAFEQWYEVEKEKLVQAKDKAARISNEEAARARKVARKARNAKSEGAARSEDEAERERDLQDEVENLLLQKERQLGDERGGDASEAGGTSSTPRPVLSSEVVRCLVQEAFVNVSKPPKSNVARSLLQHLIDWRMVSAAQVLDLPHIDAEKQGIAASGLISRLVALQDWDLALLAASRVVDIQETELVYLLTKSVRADQQRATRHVAGVSSSNTNESIVEASPARVLAALSSRPALIDSAAFKHALLKSRLTDAASVAGLLSHLHVWLEEGARIQTKELGEDVGSKTDSVEKRKEVQSRRSVAKPHDEEKIVMPGVDECLTMLTVLLDVYFPLLLQSPSTWNVLRRLSKSLTQLVRSSAALKSLMGPLTAFARLSADLAQVSEHSSAVPVRKGATRSEEGREVNLRRTALAAVDLGSAPIGVKETGGGVGHANLLAAKTAHKTGEARKGDSVRVKAMQESALVGAYTVERLAF